jgi:DNA-directed RNA polymerase subunit RPC12/RpoP
MATGEDDDPEITTWVCLTCGNELYARGEGRMACPRCGGRVFRPFDSPSPRDEVARDFLESTGRQVELGDPDAETSRADVRDLRKM